MLKYSLLLAVLLRNRLHPRLLPASVSQIGDPLVARETNRLGVVIRPHSGRRVGKNDLAGFDIPAKKVRYKKANFKRPLLKSVVMYKQP